jgi:hypothetical protein
MALSFVTDLIRRPSCQAEQGAYYTNKVGRYAHYADIKGKVLKNKKSIKTSNETT